MGEEGTTGPLPFTAELFGIDPFMETTQGQLSSAVGPLVTPPGSNE